MFSRRYYESIGLLALRLKSNGLIYDTWDEAIDDPKVKKLLDSVERDLKYKMSSNQVQFAVNFSRNPHMIPPLLADEWYDINQVR